MLLFASACTTQRLSHHQAPTAPVAQTVAATDEQAPAAAQTSAEAENTAPQPFRASDAVSLETPRPADNLTASNTTQDNQTAIRSLREQVKQKPMSLAKRTLVNAALKKIEKSQAKYEAKKIKAEKQGKAIPSEYRLPIIIGAIGLALIIVGAFGVGVFYVLGSIMLAGALIWAILILAEVI